MANRLMANRTYSHERDIKRVFAKVTIGAVGAPTLDTANSKGVLSITRNSAGDYTVVFGTSVNGVNVLDSYVKFLGLDVTQLNATGIVAAASSIVGIKGTAPSPFVDATQTSIEIVFSNGTAAADPASGVVIFLGFDLGDSSAG